MRSNILYFLKKGRVLLLRIKELFMFSILRRKVFWTAITVLALLGGLSLIACSQPDDPTNPGNIFDAATPNITDHPQSGTWDTGTDTTHVLSVTATRSDGGTLSYQWYSNISNTSTGGSILNGKTGATLTLSADDYDENGTHHYYVVVTNTNNNATGKRTATATSNVAQIQVNGIGGIYDAEQPEITAHPQSGSWNVGTAPTFELTVVADVEEGGSLSYQWYSNDSDSNDGGDEIVGEETDTLTLSKDDYTVNGEYYFYVVVTNTNDNVTGTQTASVASEAATVTVTGNGSAPVFTVPADLIGSWRDINTPEETYTVTSTTYSFSDGTDSYAGTIVNHVADGAGAGYLTIEYTANTLNSSAVGKFTVIHYKLLTPSSVSVAGAYKAEDPNFGVGGAGGKATKAEAETAYTVAAGYFADYSLLTKPLVDGVWRDGEITTTVRAMNYIFDVEEGKTYYIWWNDSYQGPSPTNKTIDIRAAGKYSDAETYRFGTANSGTDSGWITPEFFTSDRDGSFTITISPYNTTNIGTFAVVFSTVSIRPGAAVPSGALSADVWKENSIATDEIHVYTINVTEDTTYYFWWNERAGFANKGDGTKTADVQVQARYADDTLIFNNVNTTYTDQWVETSWGTAPTSFIAERTGTVDLRVRPYNTTTAYPGTYGIVYSTGDTMPLKDSATLESVTANGGSGIPTTALTLTFDKVVNGLSVSDITLGMSGSLFGVTKGALSGTGPEYTLGVSTPMDGTVTVTMGSVLLTIEGSPQTVEVYGDPSLVPSLVADTWTNGNLPAGDSVDWYKIEVTAGTPYYVWWNERPGYNGDGDGSKTADVAVSAWKSDGSAIFGNLNNAVDAAWLTSQPIAASATDGAVYVRVHPYNSGASYVGTYSITYSATNTRPAIPTTSVTLSSVTADGDSETPTTELTLVFSQAITGLSANDITLSMENLIGVSKGSLSGTGPTYTLGVSSPLDGTLTVEVKKGGFTIIGSPAEVTVYSDGSITELDEGVWVDGELTAVKMVEWYSFDVTAGETYYVWVNDYYEGDGTKDGDVVVHAWYAGGTKIFGDNFGYDEDYGWDDPVEFEATETGTVYVRVMTYSDSSWNIGTYGIAYSTDDTRPE
jgi:hypothetical protein